MEVDKGELGVVVRTPRIDGDRALPVSGRVLASIHLHGDASRLDQGGFPARLHGQGLPESSQCFVVPAEAGQRVALALPGGHIIRPRRQSRLEQRECDPRTLRPVAAQGHATVSLDLGSLVGIHPLAVENDQVPSVAAGSPGLGHEWISSARMTGNAMIRRRGMRDVEAARLRHVTAGAVIVPAPLQPVARGKAATPLGVTHQAATSVIGHLLRGRGEMVWIVAGNAPEPTSTGAEATALVHLFELADKTVFGPVRRLHEHGPEAMKRQPGPIVLISPTDPHNPGIAGQVALRTDVIPERGRQIGRIDDRHVLAVDHRGTCDVKFAGPVTAFTADCVTLEDRRSILVDRACHRLDPVRVAEQAIGLDRPVEVIVERFKTRGQIPSLLSGIPGKRGLEKEAIVLDQVGSSLPAGADHELDLGLVLGDDPARCVASRLLVKDVTVPMFDGVLEALALEESPAGSLVALRHVGLPDGSEGAAHRVLAEGLGALRVAADTRGIPEILHLRPGVLVGRDRIVPMDAFCPRAPPRNEDHPGAHHHQNRGEKHDLLFSQSPRSGFGFDRALQLAVLITGPAGLRPAQRTLRGTTRTTL